MAAGHGDPFAVIYADSLGLQGRHLRGAADPYVLADPVLRTQRFAPHGHYVTISGAGHYAHEENPVDVNERLAGFLAGA